MNYLTARKNMVEQQVKPWFVFNKHVLEIMNEIPRELFVPPNYLKVAYSDVDIPLSANQTMLSPKIVGRALDKLALTGTEQVLEIGTGSGYITACLSKLANKVVSLEINPDLYQLAQSNLNQLQIRNVNLLKQDGVLGHKPLAPYDAIIVTGSYPLGVPQLLCDQLKPFTGRLFAFCGIAPSMQAILISQGKVGDFKTEQLFETVVPPLVNAPMPALFSF